MSQRPRPQPYWHSYETPIASSIWRITGPVLGEADRDELLLVDEARIELEGGAGGRAQGKRRRAAARDRTASGPGQSGHGGVP